MLGRLVDAGNTVLVIEHNLDVIKTADWLVDMGPDGGSRGGTVVAEGTPEEVAAHPTSYTGRFLAPLLEGREAKQPARKKAASTAPVGRGARLAPTKVAAKPATKPAAKSPARKATRSTSR